MLRLGLVGYLDVFSGGRAGRESRNVVLTTLSPLTVTLLLVVTVVCAPLIEELVFRGLLLRTFMQLMPFWPSAILSTALFAGLHVYEVSTVLGAVTLVVVVGSMGLVNCVLVRYTGRLPAGMLVHATLNLIAVLALVVTSHN